MRASSTQATLQLEVAGNEPPDVMFVVTLSLPGGVYPDASVVLDKVHVEAATTTDVPDGTRIDEGYPQRTATFTLSGSVDPTDETKTVSWLFGRYSTGSPLYRLDCFRSLVTIDVQLFPQGAGGTAETFRQFTGYVDDYTENDDGSIDFECVDYRSDLRNVPDIPAVVTAAPFNAGLTSEFAVDALLRSSTSGVVSTWPKQRANVVFAAGMRSSIWPEVGTINTGLAFPPSFTPGKFGSAYTALTSSQSIGYVTAQTLDLSVGMFVEFWSSGFTEVVFAGGTVVAVVPSSGQLQIVLPQSKGTLTLTIPVDTAIHYTGVAFACTPGTTSYTLTVYYDGTTLTTGARTAGSAWTAGTTTGSFGVTFFSTGATIEALQITAETGVPASNAAFTPTAVIDPSLNTLQIVPEITGDPWQTIQDIATAEQAVAGFDEYGIFQFQNRRTLADATAARSVTSIYSLKSLTVANSTASVVNRAQVGYTAWTTAPTPSTWIYQHAVATKVPAHGTVTLTPTLDDFVTSLDAGVTVLPNGSASAYYSVYRASTDMAGTREHPGLNFAVTQPSGANKLTILITNPTTLDAYLVSPANYTDMPVGTVLLNIAGRLVTQNTEQTADNQWPPAAYTWSSGLTGAAGSRFGEVAWNLTGNQWIQDAATADTLSKEVVTAAAVPLPDLGQVDIVPDPRLQLTDVIHIQDPDVSNVDEYGRVFGITIDYEASADPGSPPTYTQTIDVRTLAAPGGWILGVAGRSEIGTGSGTSDSTAYVYAAG